MSETAHPLAILIVCIPLVAGFVLLFVFAPVAAGDPAIVTTDLTGAESVEVQTGECVTMEMETLALEISVTNATGGDGLPAAVLVHQGDDLVAKDDFEDLETDSMCIRPADSSVTVLASDGSVIERGELTVREYNASEVKEWSD